MSEYSTIILSGLVLMGFSLYFNSQKSNVLVEKHKDEPSESSGKLSELQKNCQTCPADKPRLGVKKRYTTKVSI